MCARGCLLLARSSERTFARERGDGKLYQQLRSVTSLEQRTHVCEFFVVRFLLAGLVFGWVTAASALSEKRVLRFGKTEWLVHAR